MSSRERCCRNQLTKFFLASFLLVLSVYVQNVRPDDLNYDTDPSALVNNCQLDNVLQSLLTEDELASMHVQALRQELLRILTKEANNEDVLGDLNDDVYSDDKRSIAALAKSGQFPYELKRNLGSLARSGLLKSYSKKSIANLAKNGQLPTLQAPEEEMNDEDQKRSLSSLARSGNMNRYYKKNIGSLLRSGFYPGKRYDYYEEKRNIGALARNGYLKRDIDNFLDELHQKRYLGSIARQYNLPASKRNLGSLARNGELNRYNNHNSMDADKRNVQSLMRYGGLPGKRNLASLVRQQTSPFYGRYERNIGAIARDWALPNQSYDKSEDEKRNVAALLRQDSYLHSMNGGPAMEARPTPEDRSPMEDKRNLASLKAQATTGYDIYRKVKRSKRSPVDYYLGSDEYSEPVVQNTNSLDYEDPMSARYPVDEKRFLGSVARGGWYRGGQVRLTQTKRHIGSLARSGWLPSFRYARSRFSRSGRSVQREYSALPDGRIRKTLTDGSDGDFEYDTIEPYLPEAPIPSIQDQLGRRLDPEPIDKPTSHENCPEPDTYDDTEYQDYQYPPVSPYKRYLLLPAIDNILLKKLYTRRIATQKPKLSSDH